MEKGVKWVEREGGCLSLIYLLILASLKQTYILMLYKQYTIQLVLTFEYPPDYGSNERSFYRIKHDV